MTAVWSLSRKPVLPSKEVALAGALTASAPVAPKVAPPTVVSGLSPRWSVPSADSSHSSSGVSPPVASGTIRFGAMLTTWVLVSPRYRAARSA
ncbi:hypothetical protein ACIHAA_24655 [Streptomyces sp. NPDC052040]|uniref:hypothetical protein n=1 Tax=Streptomyces sp. NPDC052040 TaxID=3365682 RepID=UPI0037D5B472